MASRQQPSEEFSDDPYPRQSPGEDADEPFEIDWKMASMYFAQAEIALKMAMIDDKNKSSALRDEIVSRLEKTLDSLRPTPE